MSETNNNTSCGTSCGCAPTPKYWQDVENKTLEGHNLTQEFSEKEFDSFSVEKSRRSFLKIMGFSVSALPLTGCVKIPVKKALPYLNKNDTVIPGVANWYASTWDGMPVLVKTREGRPIKVEGNSLSTVTKGGASARMQASVLSLYDSYRYRAPQVNSSDVEWEEFDKQLTKALKEAASSGKDLYLVTSSVSSPSELSLIKEFTRTYNAKHVGYDAVSRYAWAKANEVTHGVRTISEYDLSKADMIVSVGVDFLGTWGKTVQNAKQYANRKDPKQGLTKHIQIEEVMSLTGSNADTRYTKTVVEQRNLLLGVLAGLTGDTVSGYSVSSENKELVESLVRELKYNRGRSLFLYGENDVDCQVVANKINDELRNYGSTVTVHNKPYEFVADDNAFEGMVKDAANGGVAAVLFMGVNPVYNYYNPAKLTEALSKVAVKVSFATSPDETSKLCEYVAPANHAYESWGDAQVSDQELSFAQPVIQPLFGSRMATETLMALAGVQGTYHDYMQAVWKRNFLNKQSRFSDFTQFWNQGLHDGVVELPGLSPKIHSSVSNVMRSAASVNARKATAGLALTTYSKVGMGDGAMANNPWLQEMPDPITKATWDNYLMVGPAHAKKLGATTGSVVKLTVSGATQEVPVMVQPGMANNTVALAVGYGRKVSGRAGKGVGVNAFAYGAFDNGSFQYSVGDVAVAMTDKTAVIAQTQTHHSMEGRDIVRETTYEAFKTNPKAGNEKKAKLVNIYPAHKKMGHQWAMAIDLNKCTGCSACIVSCNAENNIPVVGKKEVATRREMHWMRLDRYYAGDENQPEVVHMPMTCQHCDNAPCENVCPVMATLQSSDGLNQQVYNRCVGTRYCANNCPYKVRRFNWFNYDHSDEVERMVLNPDVNVRSRGVMEKCSMCIQRIQEGKLEAKKQRRELRDGDIKTACQQSCPSDAIVFGDMKDESSKIAQYLGDERNYVVLEELNVQPRVSYLTKIRNK